MLLASRRRSLKNALFAALSGPLSLLTRNAAHAADTVSDAPIGLSYNSIISYGARGDGTDESSFVMQMISAENKLHVPAGMTLTCKNIELLDNTKVTVDGAIKLPKGCSDNDKILLAVNKSGLVIDINEVDGNSAGQSGIIGTHLIYLTNCDSPVVNVKLARDHYARPVGQVAAPDAIRDTSTGAIFLYRCTNALVSISQLRGWGREGIQLRECLRSTVSLGHAQGTGNSEYSGLQVSGKYNKILRASVDSAGASGVGFDTEFGEMSNVVSTNSRKKHGVNCGHPSYPATNSVLSNITVDRTELDGICIAASTHGLKISNFSITNAGRFGVNVSDDANDVTLSNGSISNSGQSNINAFKSNITTYNTSFDKLDTIAVHTVDQSNDLMEGEIITTQSGSAVIRAIIKPLDREKKILLLTDIKGDILLNQKVFGKKSSATSIIVKIHKPSRLNTISGGQIYNH